ncbi:MAG TPA: rod shape-determining protein MreC [Magnetospirillaceae bacterium]|jgi:rod shape-determining protein MreC
MAMMPHSGVPGRLATLRQLAQRFAFVALVLASFMLMLLGKADTLLLERVRLVVQDTAAPVLDVMSRPAAAIARLVDAVSEIARIRADNVRLKEENERLMQWQTVARRLDEENRALHNQLNFIPDPSAHFVTARVVGDTGGAFVDSMLVNAGSHEGIRKGEAVMSGEAMIGRIAEVGMHFSRVLLLTDINSHLPVMLESSHAKAIMAGENTDRPRLNYLSPNAVIQPGDRVVTSGDGGAFPPGLPIGVISSVQDGVAKVEPYVHRYQLEYVAVVDYGLPGVIDTDSSDSSDSDSSSDGDQSQ